MRVQDEGVSFDPKSVRSRGSYVFETFVWARAPKATILNKEGRAPDSTASSLDLKQSCLEWLNGDRTVEIYGRSAAQEHVAIRPQQPHKSA